MKLLLCGVQYAGEHEQSWGKQLTISIKNLSIFREQNNKIPLKDPPQKHISVEMKGKDFHYLDYIKQ